ncbi:MAG: hypothetical protein MPJ24_06000 [Pirellulaceae bacterium]|nr:hypothetical protein [Pirellulaceae bacterium]
MFPFFAQFEIFGKVFCRLVLFALLVVGCPAFVHGDIFDSFETEHPTWKLLHNNTKLQILTHRRSFTERHHLSASEEISFTAGYGSQVYYGYALNRARIIEELSPKLWLKSDRNSLQLLGYVVFPHAKNPRTGEPLTAVIQGDFYQQSGRWQQLSLKNIPALVEEQIRVFRLQFGQDFNAREAYLDQLILNVYGGPGKATVWIDELEVSGLIESLPKTGQFQNDPKRGLQHSGQNRGAGQRDQGNARIPHLGPQTLQDIQFQGEILEIDKTPFLPLIIDYNGETFEELKRIGFNVLRLKAPPTSEQRRLAQELDLWFLSPPPVALLQGKLAVEYPRVLAWTLVAPRQGGTSSMTAFRSQLERVKQNDSYSRPLLVESQDDFWKISRMADALLVEGLAIGTARTFSDSRQKLLTCRQEAKIGTPLWATIATEPLPTLKLQNRLVDLRSSQQWHVEAQQLRLAVLTGVSAGVDGYYFVSHSRLDSGYPADQFRALALAQINAELQLLRPWLLSGEAPSTLTSSQNHQEVTILQNDRGKLILSLPKLSEEQFVYHEATDLPAEIIVPGVTESDQAFAVSPAGLLPLRHQRVTGGMRLDLATNSAQTSLVLVSQNQLAIDFIQRQLQKQRSHNASQAVAIAEELLVETKEVYSKVADRYPTLSLSTELQKGEALLKRGRDLLITHDYTHSEQEAQKVIRLCSQIRHRLWKETVAPLPSPLSSPWCNQFATLPNHWQVVDRLRQSRWSTNLLPASDFENLDNMIRTGWKQYQVPVAGATTSIELSSEPVIQGDYALHLQVINSSGQNLSTVGQIFRKESPAVVQSAPLVVRQGQLLRVSGAVRIVSSMPGKVLSITDSITGDSFDYPISSTQGEWRSFTFYRLAPGDGEFSLWFKQRTTGDVWLDKVTVEVATLQ